MTTTITTPRTATTSRGWRQIAGLAGVLAVALWFTMGLTILDGPGVTDSAADARAWYEAHGTEVALFTWAMPFIFGGLLLLFASGLRSLLAPADADSGGMWARFSFAGAVSQAGAGFIGLAFWGVLAQDEVLAVVSDETLKTLTAFDSIIFFTIMAWPSAVFVVGASVVILQSGVLPKWIGWLGSAVALAGVVGALWILSGDPDGFLGAVLGTVGFLGNLVWILAVSVSMIRSTPQARSASGNAIAS